MACDNDFYGEFFVDESIKCGGAGDATADAIAESITGPKSATVDGVSVTQYSPAELIAAARFLAAQKAAKQPHRGLRFTKLVSPGAQ